MRGYPFVPGYRLPIVTGAVMAEIDRIAIAERGVPGERLMERAGCACARFLMDAISPERLRGAAILCGKGNNGGDGFVIARTLFQEGFSPKTASMGLGEELKGDARLNWERLQALGAPLYECPDPDSLQRYLREASDAYVWVDALLGTGARGAPRGLIAQAVEAIQSAPRPKYVVSVDISSGVDADSGAVEGLAVEADAVVTFGLPKIGHVVPPGLDYRRRVVIEDIGFPQDLIESAQSDAELLTSSWVDDHLPRRGISTHKGSQGRLLIVAGSLGMTGAASMCAQAALRMGAGLIHALCPISLLPIYAQGVWEIMTLPAPETETGAFAAEAWEIIRTAGDFDAVAIGPGMGRHPSTETLIRRAVASIEAPMVIDGDALNALRPSDFASRSQPWVATPHPGEMARLFGVSVAEVQADRWGFARKLAGERGVVALKGPCTVVAGPKGLSVNPTGSAAMASGGMGDTLTGMIGALLANGMEAHYAASVGVFLHGLAADIAVEETGAEALSAGQVSATIQRAVRRMRDEADEIKFPARRSRPASAAAH